MTSFYENQESGTNGLGVPDRFPWQGSVAPSGSAQVPNLNAFSQQENAPNIFQQQLTPPSGLADVNGIQQAMQKFQMQPKTVMASDMDDTESKFRNLAAKYAAQDNSKPQQSSTGEDNGVSYKTRDEDHATGPDAWASLGKFMKTGEEKTAGVIGNVRRGVSGALDVGKNVGKFLSGKPLTATSFTAGAGGDIIGEEAYDALGWGPKAPVDPKAPVKPRGLGKLWQSDRSTTQNLEEFWRRGFRGLAAGSVGSKRFIPAVRASAQQKQRNFLKGLDPDIAKGLPQVPGTGEYMSGLADQLKPKMLALVTSEIPRLSEHIMNFTGSHADVAENLAKGTETVPNLAENLNYLTMWDRKRKKGDPKRNPGGLQQFSENISDAGKAQGEILAQAGESVIEPLVDRLDRAFPSIKPPEEGAAPGTAPGTPQEPSKIERALAASESLAESAATLTGRQGSAGGGGIKPTGDGSTGDSNANTVKILTDSATSIGNFMNTANKWLPWVAGGTVGVGGLYALYKVFESRRRDREEKERRALLHAMPLGYKAAAEKQAILVAPWEGTELTPYQYGFAVRVHEANLSPQQIEEGIEKVAEYMGEEYAEELREGMEKIAFGAAVKPMLQGAWNVGKGYLQKKLPHVFASGVAQKVAPKVTQQVAKQVAPQATKEVAKKVAPKVTQQAASRVRPLKPGPHVPASATRPRGGSTPTQAWQEASAGRQYYDDLIRNAAEQVKAPVPFGRRALDATKAAPGQAWRATGGQVPYVRAVPGQVARYGMPTARAGLGGMTGYNMSGDDATMGETARNTLLGMGMGWNMPTLKKHLPSVGSAGMGMFYGSGAGETLDEINRLRGVEGSNYGQIGGWGGAGLGASKNKIINPLFNRFTPQTVKNIASSRAVPMATGAGVLAMEAAPPIMSMNDSSTGGTGVPPTQSGVPPTQGGEPPSGPTTPMGLPEEDLTSNPGAAPEVAPGAAPEVAPGEVPETPPVPADADKPSDTPSMTSGFMDILKGLGKDPRVASFGGTIDPILDAIGGEGFSQKINPLMKILMMAGGGLGIGGLLGGGKKMGLGGLGMMAIPLIYQMMQGKKDEGAAAGAGTAAAGTAAASQASAGDSAQQVTEAEQIRFKNIIDKAWSDGSISGDEMKAIQSDPGALGAALKHPDALKMLQSATDNTYVPDWKPETRMDKSPFGNAMQKLKNVGMLERGEATNALMHPKGKEYSSWLTSTRKPEHGFKKPRAIWGQGLSEEHADGLIELAKKLNERNK